MNLESNNLKLLTTINKNADLQRISAKLAAGPIDDEKKEKLKKVCQDMEGLFLEELLKSMRKTVPESGLFGKGLAHEIYREMLDKELVKRMSHSSGIGLARILYRQLTESYDDEKIQTKGSTGEEGDLK